VKSVIEVRMNTLYAGPKGNCHPGGTITVDDDEAKALVDGRYAEYVVKPSDGEGDNDDETGNEGFPEDLIKLGGGYFELPNGEKVRGKDKALAAYEALKATE
jgi:hypothetical protein